MNLSFQQDMRNKKSFWVLLCRHAGLKISLVDKSADRQFMVSLTRGLENSETPPESNMITNYYTGPPSVTLTIILIG